MAETTRAGGAGRTRFRRGLRDLGPREALAAKLVEAIGEPLCIRDEPSRRAFFDVGDAASLPCAVVLPSSQEAVAAVINACGQAGAAWMVQGAGRCSVGANDVGKLAQSGPWVLISTARLDRIAKPDLISRTVTVEAGARLADVEATLAEAGATLGFELPDGEVATIGGALVTGTNGRAIGWRGPGGATAAAHGLAQRLVAVTGVKSDGTRVTLNQSAAASGLPDLGHMALSRIPPSLIVVSAELAVTWQPRLMPVSACMLANVPSAGALADWWRGRPNSHACVTLATRPLADALSRGKAARSLGFGERKLLAVLEVADDDAGEEAVAGFEAACEAAGGRPFTIAAQSATSEGHAVSHRALVSALQARGRRTRFVFRELSEIAPDGVVRAALGPDAVLTAIDKLNEVATAELCEAWIAAHLGDGWLICAFAPLDASNASASVASDDGRRLRRGLSRAVRVLAELGGQVDIRSCRPRAHTALGLSEAALRQGDSYDPLAIADRARDLDRRPELHDEEHSHAASGPSLMDALRDRPR